jgi:hypothetical protein
MMARGSMVLHFFLYIIFQGVLEAGGIHIMTTRHSFYDENST